MSTDDFGSIIVYIINTPDQTVGCFSFPVLIDTVYGVAQLLLIFVTHIITENKKKMLIKSATRRAKATGAKCTPAEIAELLTTEPSDIESKSNDVLL